MFLATKSGQVEAKLVITSITDGQVTATLLGDCSLCPGNEIVLGVDQEDLGTELDLNDPDVWMGNLEVKPSGPGRRRVKEESQIKEDSKAA